MLFRSDSLRIANEAIDSAKDYILKNIGGNYYPDKPNVYTKKKGQNTQDAHEAIRPSDISLSPDKIKDSLTNDQYKLYKLIWNRFVSSQLKPAEFAVITVEIEAKHEKNIYNFRSTDQQMTFDGYLKFYVDFSEDDEEESSKIPNLSAGEQVKIVSLFDKQNFTNPPGRYTEASLIKALEEKGIGRPSTYAPTISTILNREYIEKEGKSLKITQLGRIVTDLMKNNFENIVDEKFTANMEDTLDNIENDGKDWREVLTEFYGDFKTSLEKANEDVEKMPEVSDVICENCGKNMIVKSGRFGKFLACPNYPDCKTTKPLTKEVDVPCPKCNNKILEKKSRAGKIFYGCEKYPDCDFASWDLPTGKSCDKCGSYMVKKKFIRSNKEYCSNVDCENAAPKPKPKADGEKKVVKTIKITKKR